MSILMNLLSNNGYIIVNKEIIKRIGLHEAIILGELCSEYTYWEKAKKLENGFFFSTRENIEQNTGLSAYQQREAFKKLVEIGVVLELSRGLPQQKWYSLNMEKLYEILNGELDLITCTKEIKGQEEKKFNTSKLNNLTTSNNKNIFQDVNKLETNNNINNNINSNKKQYEEKIFLTEEQYNDIKEKYGKSRTDDIISELNLYKKSSGKNYADDYYTILLWLKREERKTKDQKQKFSNYKGRDYPQDFFEDNMWYDNFKEEFDDEICDN